MSDAETTDTGSGSSVLNIVAGLLLAAVSVCLLIVIIPDNIGQATGKNDISPSLFPTMAAWLLLALSLALVAVHSTKLRNRGLDTAGRHGGWILAEAGVWMLIATLTYTGLQTVGFLVVTAALIVIAALACGYRNFWMIGGLALAMPLITSQLAWLVFQVQLP